MTLEQWAKLDFRVLEEFSFLLEHMDVDIGNLTQLRRAVDNIKEKVPAGSCK